MDKILIPAVEQIAAMSLERCRHERLRLKNEISFARGNALWGGPSGEEQIVAYKHAIEAIEDRMAQLTLMCGAGASESGHACGA
ncbi:MAG TPA: hypothetical protein VMD75_06630 [Candidatus Binataceae bacterium]|nr:hypothetical protein [Candidatus Binataceae bacterium]